VINDVDE
jgi:hypothetical protein